MFTFQCIDEGTVPDEESSIVTTSTSVATDSVAHTCTVPFPSPTISIVGMDTVRTAYGMDLIMITCTNLGHTVLWES